MRSQPITLQKKSYLNLIAMDLRVFARVREITEDMLLQDLEPEEIVFVWRKKYIKPFDIENYWELEKGKKTVIVYSDGAVDVIREDIDKFAKRLETERSKCVEEKEYEIETDVEEEEEQEDEF